MTGYVMEAFGKKRFKKATKSRFKKLIEIYSTARKQVKSIANKLEFKNTNPSIIAYAQTDKQELALIMKLLNLKSVQIAKSPWNKEPIGIIKLSDLENIF